MPVEYIINVQEYTAFFIGLVGEIQISEALCLEVFVGISIPLSQESTFISKDVVSLPVV